MSRKVELVLHNLGKAHSGTCLVSCWEAQDSAFSSGLLRTPSPCGHWHSRAFTKNIQGNYLPVECWGEEQCMPVQ